MRKLNLGCGNDIRSPSGGWVNMDRATLPGVDVAHDFLDFPWPFGDGEFSHVHCSHVLEHVPHHISGQRKDGLVLVMEEIHRVLAPGGTVEIRAPHPDGGGVWIDPTHTRVIHPGNFAYFEPASPQFAYYSTARFHTRNVETSWWLYRGHGKLPIGRNRHGLMDHLRARVPGFERLLRREPWELRVDLEKA